MDRSLVQNIASGQFSIYDLPKLHKKEYLRSKYIAKSVEGYTIAGGSATAIPAATNLTKALKDLPTFLSAWLVYVSIRTSYNPERGAALLMWIERVIDLNDAGYDFHTILEYVIAYFQKHQNSPAEYWFKSDSDLHSDYLGNATQRALTLSRFTTSYADKSWDV